MEIIILVSVILVAGLAGLFIATRDTETKVQLLAARQAAASEGSRADAYAEVWGIARARLEACSDVNPEAAAILAEVSPRFGRHGEISYDRGRPETIPVLVRAPRSGGRHS